MERVTRASAGRGRTSPERTSTARHIHPLQAAASQSPRVRYLAELQAAADARPAGAPAAAAAPILQPKARFVRGRADGEGVEDVEVNVGVVKKALAAIKDDLEVEADRELVDHLVAGEQDAAIGEALARLEEGAIDYGRFDLDVPGSVLLLFYEVKREVRPPKEGEAARDRPQTRTAKTGETIYDRAFLGRGASIAYAMITRAADIDAASTVVIGLPDPWAGQRGREGVINHPQHMIAAIRDEVGHGEEKLMDRQAFAESVAQIIAQHANAQIEAKIGSVKEVEVEVPAAGAGVDEATFEAIKVYEITADGHVVYARRVVAGLGIGPQKKQRGVEAGAEPRVLNMDEFQQKADDPDYRAELKGKTVVVGGPNAVIDVVTTLLRNEAEIIWAPGSGRPAMLPGTDNELVEQAYNEATDADYEKVLEGLGYGQITRLVPGYVVAVQPTADGVAVRVENKRDEKEPQKHVDGDLYVYGIGPDTAAVAEVFDAEIRRKLQPTYDRNRVFGSGEGAGPPSVLGLEARADAESSLEIVGGSAFRMAQNTFADPKGAPVRYAYVDELKAVANQECDRAVKVVIERRHATPSGSDNRLGEPLLAYAQQVRIFATTAAKIVRLLDAVTSRAQLEGVKDRFPNLPDKSEVDELDAPLSSIGLGLDVHASRILWVAQELFVQVGAYLDEVESAGHEKRRPKLSDPRLAATHMAGVVDTMPENVAGSDQLAPTRAALEGREGYQPAYIGREVNFATDNRSMLAVYIANRYPAIPGHEIEGWVMQIERWRRPKTSKEQLPGFPHGPLPNPLGEPHWRDAQGKETDVERKTARAFAEEIDRRLGEANRKAMTD